MKPLYMNDVWAIFVGDLGMICFTTYKSDALPKSAYEYALKQTKIFGTETISELFALFISSLQLWI